MNCQGSFQTEKVFPFPLLPGWKLVMNSKEKLAKALVISLLYCGLSRKIIYPTFPNRRIINLSLVPQHFFVFHPRFLFFSEHTRLAMIHANGFTEGMRDE